MDGAEIATIISAVGSALAAIFAARSGFVGKRNAQSLARVEPQVKEINHAVNETPGQTLSERVNDIHAHTVPAVAPTEPAAAVES